MLQKILFALLLIFIVASISPLIYVLVEEMLGRKPAGAVQPKSKAQEARDARLAAAMETMTRTKYTDGAYHPGQYRLAYQNNEPVFAREEYLGHRINLTFGDCWMDDHNRPVIVFYINLAPGEIDWEVTWKTGMDYQPFATREQVKHFKTQEPKIAEMVEGMNHAIQARQAFDLYEYIQFWKQWDEEFYISMITDEYAQAIASYLHTENSSP